MSTVETPVGPARYVIAQAEHPVATLVLGHGAGGGIAAADLVALASSLPARGISVARVEQPWRVAERRIATAPPILDRAWVAVLDQLPVSGRLVVGGRSAGARVACRTAVAVGASGVVALSFPLHLPGRPERSRLDELLLPIGAGVPTLVVQGDRDAFGGPGEFPPEVDVRPVAGADHSLRVRRPLDPAAAMEAVVQTVGDWVLDALP